MIQSFRWLLALVIDARDTKIFRNLVTKASDMTNGKDIPKLDIFEIVHGPFMDHYLRNGWMGDTYPPLWYVMLTKVINIT